MDHTTLSWFITCSVICGTIYASPIPNSSEASGFGESKTPEPTSTPSAILSNQKLQPTDTDFNGKNTTVEPYLLNDVLGFLNENLFLILVISGLVILIFFLICSSVVLSQRTKVSVYYPCSYPAKMYVDETDKTGGARTFSEVPEKSATSSMKEPTNKAKQLQEDIIKATKNLRTPTKSHCKEEKDKNPSKPDEKKIYKKGEEGFGVAEEKNPEQCVGNGVEEVFSSRTSQDTEPVCHVENSDPSNANLPSENEHPSGSHNSEADEEKDKQEAIATAVPFIIEEKTAF